MSKMPAFRRHIAVRIASLLLALTVGAGAAWAADMPNDDARHVLDMCEQRAKQCVVLDAAQSRALQAQDAPICEYLEFDGEISICCCEGGVCSCGGLV